ncbi:DNA polymerase I [Calderihabitans maritimus]|uniref:DNA polymerase I n=1 Tax=Calderihabitans maritimus TaxID=1246530 RepID=A0A1Z5HSA5_9FIRM|nr:DNA polymerase I [Calderihabitans maritimus]GAW92403.1 DNA polymerase I [Calderihabitans maritimus]
MNADGKQIMLIDGNSLVHRAFYALPLLSNRQGVYTNAVYGFTTMLYKILAQESPDYIAVAFDKGRVTFRHEQFQDYKGHRKETPEELRPQFPWIKKILRAMNIPVFELEGFEADDLIGTLAKEAERAGLNVTIVTGDRDTLQLISPQTRVMLTRKGISELEVFDLDTFRQKYCIEPVQMRDVKGLMGDPSDNIPGVPGIGEKTALKLVREFGSLENLLENLEQVSGAKLKQKLSEYEQQARLSKSLATIDCRAPLEVKLEDCAYRQPDYPALLEIIKELEFKSLLKNVLETMEKEKISESGETVTPGETEAVRIRDFSLLTSPEEIKSYVQSLITQGEAGIFLKLTDPDYREASVEVIALADSPHSARSIVVRSSGLDEGQLGQLLLPLINNEVKLYFHDAKAAWNIFKRWGLELTSVAGDTMVAGYLLNPTSSSYSLASLALEHLGQALVEPENSALDAALKACTVMNLQGIFDQKLTAAGMGELYREIELPLTVILAEMEFNGVSLDRAQLEEMSSSLEKDIQRLTQEIYRLAGEEFNINSPRQLGNILFNKLGLPPVKKTKTGYSTSAEVLEELASRHEIVARILEYRQLVKLKSTYVDGIKALINPATGKVHTTFNQTVTATGRLSSTEPNLQNIPIRLEAGRRIRKVFVPSPGRLLLTADYSQVELRILAHMSRDVNLIKAFQQGEDIHSRTAAEVFDVSLEQVTREMRRRAKAVNFGIVYGISEYGLARDLGISRQEARSYIERYFQRYRGVKEWIERTIAEARQNGYVTTLYNRRRYLPDLFSSNRNIRSFGERTAVNTPIQGSAADIIKLAMVRVNARLKENNFQTNMILQVHDELVFDVPKEEVKEVAEIVRQSMERVATLEVPLKVDIKVGPNWYDLTPLESWQG